MLRLIVVALFCACSLAVVRAEDNNIKDPKAEEIQKALEAEFGDYGKPYSKADSYKTYTWNALKASKVSLKYKKVQFEGTFVEFSDTFPKYVQDSGFSEKREIYFIVNSQDLPVIAKRKKAVTEMLGKLKKGAKVIVYGKVKEFRSKPRVAVAPTYYIYFEHIQVLSNEEEKEEEKTKEEKLEALKEKLKELKEKRPRRPVRR